MNQQRKTKKSMDRSGKKARGSDSKRENLKDEVFYRKGDEIWRQSEEGEVKGEGFVWSEIRKRWRDKRERKRVGDKDNRWIGKCAWRYGFDSMDGDGLT